MPKTNLATFAPSPLCAIRIGTTALCLVLSTAANAELALLQAPRALTGEAPLQLTLLATQDTQGRKTIKLPDEIVVRISNDDFGPTLLHLKRAAAAPAEVTLSKGQFRRISYAAALPKELRGTLHLEPIDWDVSTTTIVLDRAAPTEPMVAAAPAPSGAGAAQAAGKGTPASAAAAAAGVTASAAPDVIAPTTDTEFARISSNEPMYMAFGRNGGSNARFQLSFKFHILKPDNPASKSFLDNLYFGYTQLSIWDLQAESAPFRDSNYRPSLFYYTPDTGARANWFTSLGIAAGVEHESNGKAGDDSRSLNTLFVKPILKFGDPSEYHWTVAPKLYAYLEKNDNRDIQDYRGYMDLLVLWGKPNGWQVGATLRKGMKRNYGSVDVQVTYPLGKLIPGAGGYLWLGYFTGYGETLLDYNHHSRSQVRVGYSVFRW
ncbi:outer membrane phospholipase A [Pandoraea communis]|uniref:Phospholipase A1 n=1 Tax=Pandoraea communis TaxID=2508297 RepID=A0A5E4Y7X4_9BURK|nr:phospholipase A [Pandoraea communis]VVE44385.1 outer membrane phospholipase A [Pandoraea communis]